MTAVIPAADLDRHTVRIHPCDVCVHDCVCEVDLPSGVHFDLPDHPEVIGVQEFRNTHETLVRFEDREARVYPPETWLSVYRPQAVAS